MRVCLAFGVVAVWLCAPTAAAASACQHFQQTGGCDPNGPREGRVSCDTEVPHGSSGFCDCGAEAVNWEVSCDHPVFTCRDACFVAGLKRAHEQATGGADPARPFGDCLWRQTGGCTPTGRREPQADKPCDAWVERGASGYCLCADARRDAKSTCSHAPFRCSDECAPASSSVTAAAIADAEDDALFDSLRGTVWQLDSGQRATLDGSGKWDAPECQTATHVECLWNVNHGRVVIEWGRRGVFVAQPQQSAGADAAAGADVGGVADPTPSALVGESVTGPRATFSATLLERIGSGDYYSVLGVNDDAGKTDIKRAYRRLSVVYHPDKNSDAAAAAKFDAVRVAYEVLSNDDKRRVYDTGGEEAVQRFEQGQVRRTSDSKANLGITLAQVYTGATVQVSAKRRIVCRGCANRRSAACKLCGECPKEVRTVKRRMGPFMMNQQEQVPSKERCREDAVKLDVVVEQGVAQGHQVRFDGKGEQRPGEIPGNMVLTLDIKKHHIFERQGKHDLRMTQRLSLKEALLGFTKSVEHLDGHAVPLVRVGITKVGDVMRVKGEGMPHHNMASQHGDLLVSLAIDVPDALTPAQREAIQRLF